jgi:hypothetical protein
MTVALSIVIPTHNTRDLTMACLRSIEHAAPQSTQPPEVILIDDGSVDDTTARVREHFPRVRIISHATATGFTIAANDGLREASGELLLLLNSDAEIYADTLPRLQQAFADDPRLGAAGAALHFPDGSPQWSGAAEPGMVWIFTLTTGLAGVLQRIPGYRKLRPLDAPRTPPVDWVTGAAMAIRRAAWNEVGPLDERFHFYAQDLDFCMRLRDAGWNVSLVAEARVLHHGGVSIGKRSGIVRMRYNPELLWTDFVRFYEKRYGPERARLFARVMRAGGWMRVRTRNLARPFLGADARAEWDRDTAAFTRAIDALAKM